MDALSESMSLWSRTLINKTHCDTLAEVSNCEVISSVTDVSNNPHFQCIVPHYIGFSVTVSFVD